MNPNMSKRFLSLLLEAQQEWDVRYSGNILDMDFNKQLCHYLNHLAKYCNHKDFKLFMRNKVEHKVKTDMLIITLCILNTTEKELPLPTAEAHHKTYNELLERIFWLKGEYDLTSDDEMLYGMYYHVMLLYKKYMKDFGLASLEWIDNRRAQYRQELKPCKKKPLNK